MLLLFSQTFDQVISKSSYLSVFIIDDNTKVGPRYRQEYSFGNIGEYRCGNGRKQVEYRCHYVWKISNYCLSL